VRSAKNAVVTFVQRLWCRVGGWRPGRTAYPTGLGLASRRRFEPCMRFSRTRLTDIVHRLAYAVVDRTVPVRRWIRRLFIHS
jgi:hypothetical protein